MSAKPQSCVIRFAFDTHARVLFDDEEIFAVDLYCSAATAKAGTRAGLIAEELDFLAMTQAQRNLLHYAIKGARS